MILVTGGTGLVGSHLLFNLLNRGYKVKVLLRPTSNKENISRTFSFYTQNPSELLKNITWAEGNLLDLQSLEAALDGVTRVYHTAAFVSFKKKDKAKVLQTNIGGTANLVNLCLERGIEKFCHVSSIGALGQSEPGMAITEDLLWKPSKNVSAYSLSKYHSEMEVWRGITEGMNAVIVNPSVILGPGDWTNGSPLLFSLIDKGFDYYTTGVTGYVDVRDLVNVMVQLMESDIVNERFTVSAENLTYKQFFDYVAAALNKPIPQKQLARWKAELLRRLEAALGMLTGKSPRITKETTHIAYAKSFYDSTKLTKTIGYSFTPIEQTIRNVAAIYEQNCAQQ
ncbi:MAG TPA: NAD-dependent epimerase/dehydratase family protein [Bacteroidales bacterium]|nr:NAD-dependent epimerase/dehydratase family protein [Bacteroidales bacterium]